MKKYMKVSMIIAGIVFGVGLILSIVGAALGGSFSQVREIAQEGGFSISPSGIIFGGRRYSIGEAPEAPTAPEAPAPVDDEADLSYDGDYAGSDELLMGTYLAGEWNMDKVESLEIDISFGTLYLETSSEVDRVRVETDDEGKNIKCKLDGKNLEVEFERKNVSSWFGSDSPYIYVLIPESMALKKAEISTDAGTVNMTRITADAMKVDVDAGSVYGNDILIENDMEIDVDAGSVEFFTLSCRNLTADCDAGQICLDTFHAEGNVSLDTDAGSVSMYMDHSYLDFNYTVECDLGSITLNGESMRGFGSKHTIDNNAQQKFKASCDVGSVDIYFSEQ